MSNVIKMVIGGVVLLALGFVLGVYGSHQQPSFAGTSYDVSHLVGDVYQGMSDTLIASGGVLKGNLSAANAVLTSYLQVGGSSNANKITAIGIATSTLNNTTFGSYTQTTSTATTSISFGVGGLSAGDACSVGLTTAPANTSFGLDANITTSSASAATATITMWNGASAVVTVTTGTIRAVCIHAGI